MASSRISEKKEVSWIDQVLLVLRFCVPQLLTFVFFILPIIPINTSIFSSLTPALLLIPIYYWSIFRPNVCPPALVFVYGLAIDIISGGLLGFYAILYLSVQTFVKFQRQLLIKQSFFTIWGGFALLSLIFVFVENLVMFLLKDFLFMPMQLLLSLIVPICLYPIFSPLLILSHRLISIAPNIR